ncbi:glutathione S-transferase 1-like [Liolophura sinensis]|uniref:glutathione S-transferase 1-like n=1 Tax=Liolophura sinensis TaxID=3198878 RepID=UPI0031587DC7
MSKYRLTYFDARGRAEVSRLLFAAAGKAYEDIRIPVSEVRNKHQDWLSIKERAPFGQLPMLEVDDDFILAQSHAIERFLAREFDMYGKDEFERAEVDMFVQAVDDLLTSLIEYHFLVTDLAEKETIKQKFFRYSCLNVLDACEVRMSDPTSFLVGESLTLADLSLLDLRSWIQNVFPDDHVMLLGPYANIYRHNQMVASLPGIAEWLEKRPKTAF